MNTAAWLTWGQTMKESSKKSKATYSLIHTYISNLFLQWVDETNLKKKKKEAKLWVFQSCSMKLSCGWDCSFFKSWSLIFQSICIKGVGPGNQIIHFVFPWLIYANFNRLSLPPFLFLVLLCDSICFSLWIRRSLNYNEKHVKQKLNRHGRKNSKRKCPCICTIMPKII